MKKCVILLSGGLDSATVLGIIAEMGYEIHAISFNYSQRNAVELDKARNLTLAYSTKSHKIVNLDLGSFGGSALTDKTINVPKYKDSHELGSEIPLTYVPARNTIFLSYALGFAEIIQAYDIFLGIHATDYGNYPDCRQEFIDSFEHMANLATAAGVGGNRISFHAPLINMTKSEIVKTGTKLKVDYRNTVSCYDPNVLGQSCGQCHACLTRLQAFKDNELVDPIEYSI